jgi:hypothetical protein
VAPKAGTTGFGGFRLNEKRAVSLTNGPTPDETTLIRYLVGRASDDETERFDELSIADDEFVLRLRAVEHDLMDAYVSGELAGETLAGFTSQYLRSSSGLAKVEFARALQGAPAIGRVEQPVTSSAKSSWWPFRQWQMAAAAVAVAALAYVVIDDVRLRQRMDAIEVQRAALEQRERQLQDELNRQQTAGASAAQELARLRDELTKLTDRANATRPTSVLALLLSPATRGASDVPTLTLPEGTDAVTLRLQPVIGGYPRYEAVLRPEGSDRIIWRSARVPAPLPRDQGVLSITAPANVLEARAYAIELIGVSAGGQADPLDAYPFRVARKSP